MVPIRAGAFLPMQRAGFAATRSRCIDTGIN
jgi:hypothetical protein